ncbi:MAG: 5-formyltetrahydrofolate cyclo-ligase [Propionibacteriaceae bacterium]|nr:5-formyltetrahydrofolate cyclo-ligase [Propionibacteriaceae bacterium]
MSPAAAKAALRAGVRAERSGEPDAERHARDAARLPHLLALAKGHDAVACYVSLAPEPDTGALIEALHAGGVRVLLPLLRGRRTPAWAWYAGPGTLVPGWRGIPEPAGGEAEGLAAVSLVITSALLATRQGVRLGTGGGWYDRALVARDPDALVASVLNAREIVTGLPVEEFDVRVDALVTEDGLLTADGLVTEEQDPPECRYHRRLFRS